MAKTWLGRIKQRSLRKFIRLGLSAFLRLSRIMSLRAGVVLGKHLGWTVFYLLSKERNRALQNIQLALGDVYESEQRRRIIKNSFENLGKGIFEVLYLSRLTPIEIDQLVRIEGEELVELKRHAREIPGCPCLDRRIQRYSGNKPFVMSRDELDWLVAVLDVVRQDPKGYACVEYEPWKLEYVPPTDERCAACRRLYDRLNQENERLWEVATKQRKKATQSRKAQNVQKNARNSLTKQLKNGRRKQQRMESP